jgi:hypothetical protein
MSLPVSVETASLLFTVAGIFTLIYGFFLAFKFRNILGRGKLADAWDKVLGMISLFIFGYIAYGAQLISDEQFISLELVASLIFFAGAIFVAVVSYLNVQAFTVE